MIPSEVLGLALGIFVGLIWTRIAIALYAKTKEIFDDLHRYAMVKEQLEKMAQEHRDDRSANKRNV